MTRDKRGAYTWTGTVDAAFDAPNGAVVCLLAKGDETRQHEGDLFVPCETDGAIFQREVARRLGR